MTKDVIAMGVSAICIIAAVGLAAFGNDGWGWFLFVGVLVAGAVLS